MKHIWDSASTNCPLSMRKGDASSDDLLMVSQARHFHPIPGLYNKPLDQHSEGVWEASSFYEICNSGIVPNRCFVFRFLKSLPDSVSYLCCCGAFVCEKSGKSKFPDAGLQSERTTPNGVEFSEGILQRSYRVL